MKKNLLLLLLSFFVATRSKATVTFTVVTSACDTTNVIAIHFTGTGPLPYKVQWFAPGLHVNGIEHTVTTPNDTIFHCGGGKCHVEVIDNTHHMVDSASFLVPLPFNFHFVSVAPWSGTVGVASVSVSGGTPPYTYTWFPYGYFDSTVSTSNPTSLPINASLLWYYPVNVYGVWVKDAAGCLSGTKFFFGTSDFYYDTLLGPTSVESSLGIIEQFSIHPNPACNSFNAAVNISGTGDALINVSDLTGRVFIEKRVKMQTGTQRIPFNTEQLPTGTYFVTLINNGTTETRKLIVVK